MFQYLLTLTLLLLTYFIYTNVYLPIRLMRLYHHHFTSLGYNFKYQGFMLFGSKVFSYISFGQRVYGNPNHYLQTIKPQFDGAISSIMNRPVIHINNPELLQEYFNMGSGNYRKFGKTIENVQRVIGEGVAFSEGEQWKKKRRIISTAFHFQFLHSLIPHIVGAIDKVFDKFDRENFKDVEQQQGENEKINGLTSEMDVLSQFQKIFSDIMINLFFGCDISNLQIDSQDPSSFFLHLVNEINNQSYEPHAYIFGTSFFKLGLRSKDREINRKVKLFREFTYKLIKDKIQELKRIGFKEGDKKHGNLIEEMYLSKSINLEDQVSGSEYDFKELIEEFCTFVVAGTDTTSGLATMMVVYLEKLPAVREKILEELQGIVKGDEDWTPENLKKLVYLDACIKQSMRLFGPGIALFLREAQKTHYFKGILIKKGTLLSPEFLPNNYNPKYFPDPCKFRPQRWLTQTSSLAHSFAFTPFSGGKRNCIGQHLSNIESKIIIGKFLMRYRYEIENPVRLKSKFLVSPENFKAKIWRK